MTRSRILAEDEARWTGEVLLEGDLIVPEGARLTLGAGARVGCAPGAGALPPIERLAFGGRRPLPAPGRARLLVYGELDAEPGSFLGGEGWGGVVLLGSGRARLRGAVLEGDGYGLVCADFSSASLADCGLGGGEGGLACGGFSRVRVRRGALRGEGLAALWAHDDAEVRVSGASALGGRFGALAEGAARMVWRGGRLAGAREAGLLASGRARVRASGAWEDSPVGLEVQGRAEVDARGGRFRGHGAAVRALGRGSARLQGLDVEACATGVWAQNDSRVELEGGLWAAGGVGVQASHAARVGLRGGAWHGYRKTAFLVEEKARLSARAAELSGNENGVLLLHSARLDARDCRIRGCRDTAVWRDHRASARLAGCELSGNGLDGHVETAPTY